MSILPGPTQKFYKMQGSGNDFIVIDNRDQAISRQVMADWARALCPRAFSIGADGLIFLETEASGQAATCWHFYNADGSRAAMCGNGSRCATLLAHRLGMAGAEHLMLTDAGPVQAQVFADLGEVRVQLTPVRDLELDFSLDLPGAARTAHFANTGVPHAVLFSDTLESLDILALGPAVRRHAHFGPAGTNANFVQVLDREHILLRTFERGVENETYACGTGAAASVAVTHALGLTGPQVQVRTSGGEMLEITIRDTDIFLRGKAALVYEGEFSLTAMGLQ